MPRLPLALLLLASVIVLVPSSPQTAADERDRLKVGLQPDGRIVVPTNQILQPAGTQVTFPGRPVDLLLDRGRADARRQEHAEPRVHRPGHRARSSRRSRCPPRRRGWPARSARSGSSRPGDRVFATDSQGAVRIAKRKADGTLRLGRRISP